MKIAKCYISLFLCLSLIILFCSCQTTTVYYDSSEIEVVSVIEYPSDNNENKENSIISSNSNPKNTVSNTSENKETINSSSSATTNNNSSSEIKTDSKPQVQTNSNTSNQKPTENKINNSLITNSNSTSKHTSDNKQQNQTSSNSNNSKTEVSSKLTNNTSMPKPETSKGQSGITSSVSDSSGQYKYEYEFFDSRHYSYSVLSKGNPARIKQAFKKAKNGNKITIAFIGGSITEGTGASSSNCFSALVAKWFENIFGKNNINYINAGIGTAGSLFGVHRAEADVISHNPDIVFVDFAVNDKGKDPELESATFDAFIQKIYNSASKPAVVSVAMATEQKINAQSEEATICKKYNIPMLSFSNYIHANIMSGKFQWKDIATDNVHPNKVGHKIISELIIYYLEKVYSEIDKSDSPLADKITEPCIPESSRFVSAKRLNPTEINPISNNGFSVNNTAYQYTKGYWESTIPNSEISFTVKTNTLTLFFAKLPADGGKFELYIDGQLNGEYACKTSDTWEYINSKVIEYFDNVEEHTITIKNTSGEGKRILISGIGITN